MFCAAKEVRVYKDGNPLYSVINGLWINETET